MMNFVGLYVAVILKVHTFMLHVLVINRLISSDKT